MATRDSTMIRSALAGAAATAVDLSLLAMLVGVVGTSARLANVPALLAGAVVQFFGNRHFAFRAESGALGRQLPLFILTEAVALGLNGVLYDFVARAVSLDAMLAVMVRLGVSFVVFSAWSHPVWKRIFVPKALGSS